MTTKVDLASQVTERPATALDVGFFRQVFIADRLPEFLVSLPHPQAEALAADQFRLQTAGYAQQYPHASHRVVQWRGRPVGRVIDADQGSYLLAVDLVLEPAARGIGIGREVMRRLQAKAAATHRSLRLSAVIGTPAVAFHESLGFRTTGEAGTRIEMEWTP